MGVVVSSSPLVSAAPSPSGGGLLTLFLCSSVGPLPWERVLHGLLYCGSFLQAVVLHTLLQCGSPAGSQVLPANLLQHGLLSPWGHRSCQDPAPARVCHRVTASFGHPPPVVWGPPQAAGVFCSIVNLHGCRAQLPHHGLHHGISAPAPVAPPTPPSSLTWVSAQLFLSHILTPFSGCCCIAGFFSPS